MIQKRGKVRERESEKERERKDIRFERGTGFPDDAYTKCVFKSDKSD